MRIIGIDLGTICCGYGILEVANLKSQIPASPAGGSNLKYIVSGEIRINKKDALPVRLKTLYNSLKTVFNEYKPSHLCIEKIFYHKSIPSVFALGSARGIAMLLAAENDIPVFEYNATELKMALTGYGRAEKRQVKEMVIRILNPVGKKSISNGVNLPPLTLTEDATDALALCICHVNSANRLK